MTAHNATAGAAALALFSALHVSSLATVALVILIALGSAYMAHCLARREMLRQTQKIVDMAVAEHTRTMHVQREDILQEAAGYRPDGT